MLRILLLLFVLAVNISALFFRQGEVGDFIRRFDDPGGVLDNPRNVHKKYDFVIIGGGSSGTVLASRLSENPAWKVLLIEAGKWEVFPNDIPLFSAYLQSTSYSWPYTTEPEDTACWGMVERRCAWPRGKGVGGSSLINYMIYHRGNSKDFDKWSTDGNVGWSYKDVLPYFMKSERSSLRGKDNSTVHNRYGLLSVEDPRYRSPIAKAFVKGAKQAGYRKIDYNDGGDQIGVSYVQVNTLNGHRHSTASAFLKPFLAQRPNLHILTESRGTRILIDPKTKTAYGVEYVKDRKIHYVFATKEVILSAGAFSSPQLLMLSGVGPADELRRISIPLIKDLPVGRTLYDHIHHFGPTFVLNTTGLSVSAERIMNIPTLRSYFDHGTGPLTIIGGVEALGFLQTPYSPRENGAPDIEIIFASASISSDEGSGFARALRLQPELYNKIYKPLDRPDIDVWSALIMHFHPRSVGRVELKDSNPWHWPRFIPNALSDPMDVEAILSGIKEAIRIAETPAMQRLGTKIHDIPISRCAHLGFGTDEYWRCSIRTMTTSLHHQIATCRMGSEKDRRAVVSPRLKVYGIDQLRVVDISVAPSTTSSHTNALAIMIAEKAADMIKNDWKS